MAEVSSSIAVIFFICKIFIDIKRVGTVQVHWSYTRRNSKLRRSDTVMKLFELDFIF